MDTIRELDVVRAVPAQRQPLSLVRSDGGAGLGLLEVRFSPFNQWYEINSWWEGNFMERTVPGAFARTFDHSRSATVMPVKMLYDHGYDPTTGNKPLSTVDELAEEADSAVARGQLFDTQYVRELLPGLQAGVYGSSFRFRVIGEAWNDDPGPSDHNPKGLPERTITEVRHYEQGPVTFPANPAATAGLRSVSLTDAYYDRLRTREPARVEQLAARAAELRTPGRPGPAPHRPTDPALRHSTGTDQRRRREALYPFLRGL